MKKQQPKISEILHLAADEYLWDGIGTRAGLVVVYSCTAIQYALEATQSTQSSTIQKGLRAMGLSPTGSGEFFKFPFGKERQAARHTWLKFAAMIAEEQGV